MVIASSTFPRRPGDAVPDFVMQQALVFKKISPNLDVHVLAPHDAGAALVEDMQGLAVHRFRYFFPASMQRLAYPAILPNIRRSPLLAVQVPFFLAAEYVATRRLIRRIRPHLIYSHWFLPQALACGFAALRDGVSHAFTCHSSELALMRRVPFGGTLVRLIVDRAAAVTVVGTRQLEQLQTFFSAVQWERIAHKVRTMPMGVVPVPDAALGEGVRVLARSALEIGDDGLLLFMGRLTAKKGVFCLLDAFCQLMETVPDVRLVIAGDGELKEAIGDRICALGLTGRVTMVGHVIGEDKEHLLAAADIVVLPSVPGPLGDMEGLPVVGLEAMQWGRVLVASSAAGMGDVAEPGRDYFEYPASDGPALCRALADALSLGTERLEVMRRSAMEKASQYTWDALAPTYLEHLADQGHEKGIDRH